MDKPQNSGQARQNTFPDQTTPVGSPHVLPPGSVAFCGKKTIDNQLPDLQPTRVVQSIGHRRYDKIIADIFSSVLRAVSREELLRNVLQELPRDERNSGVCLILDCWENADDHSLILKGTLQTGAHPRHWENFCRDKLLRLSESAFLKEVMTKKIDPDLWFISPYPPKTHATYEGEFDPLLQSKRGYWISAVLLPSLLDDHPDRILIALYPNAGSDIKPRTPGNAMQECRVFQFLQLAYQLLNHQLAGVAEQMLAQRRHLLAELAPGILHHEIRIQMEVLRETTHMLVPTIRKLHVQTPSDETEAAGHLLLTILDVNNKLYSIAHAFNNLERRMPEEEIILHDVVEQTFHLSRHRLGAAGCTLEWNKQALSVRLVTDPSLLFHLLINLVINAANAIQEESSTNKIVKKRKIEVMRRMGSDTKPIRLEIINTGPAIHSEYLERIFEKGFTTRTSGHGHGLYIGRLIAESLGGSLSAMKVQELPTGFGAGFRLDLPLVVHRQSGIQDDVKIVRKKWRRSS
ncbi:MAG: HAMP domain-containing histidine kinase [Magnetococcales bacterium]|nr:HAMP domain-containing histidine kinase [Magnetococcales bacterium]